MFEKYKISIFKKRARKILSEKQRNSGFITYANAKNILLLFESDFQEKNHFIRQVIKQLQEDGKKVMAWGYIKKKVITSPTLKEYRIINHKQVDLFEKPTETQINELNDYNFDILIDLTLSTKLPLRYIALHANSTMKIGKKNDDAFFYDFTINIDNIETNQTVSDQEITNFQILDEVFLFNQLIFYLKSIQTND